MTTKARRAAAALWIAVAASATHAAPAAERNARFVLDLEVDTRDHWQRGADRADGRSRQTWHLSATLRTDGQAIAFNRMDTRTMLHPVAHVANRYLDFQAFTACDPKVKASTDERIDAQLQDVQGAMPYTVTTQGEGRASAGALAALCMQMSFVLDTATGTLHSSGNMPLPEMTVASVREGRRSTVALQPPVEVLQWAGRQLQRMPRSGAASTELPLVRDRLHAGAGGTYEGKAQVRLRWSFEAK
jgi:hypothetical protein